MQKGNRDATVVALLLADGGLGLRRRPSLGQRGLGPQPGGAGCWGDGGLARRGAGATASVPWAAGSGPWPGVVGCWGDGGLGWREAGATAGWGGDGWVALSPSAYDSVRLERRLERRTYVGLERRLEPRGPVVAAPSPDGGGGGGSIGGGCIR